MAESKGYRSRVAFDDEAKVFHDELINIRDVVTFRDSRSMSFAA